MAVPEMYDDVAQDGSAGTEQAGTRPELYDDDPEDIYEECGEQVEPSQPAAPPPPVSKPPPPKIETAQEEPDDVYDDCVSAADEKKEAEKAAEQSAPPPPPAGGRRREPPPIPATSSDPPPPPPKASLPAIPKSIPPPIPDRRPSNSDTDPPPLPPTGPPPLPGRTGSGRVPQLRKPFMDRDEDFENIFYGKWGCIADSEKELTFKPGDMIHVLSRDFDAESWWVGELDGKVGLVPKEYLCPAFELVA